MDGAFAIFIWDSSHSTVLAKPLQAVDDQTVQADPDDLRLPSQSSNLPLASNVTSSLVNTSVSFDASIRCDGDEYGFKPNVDDCTNALSRQLVGGEQIKFGQRGSISSEKFFPLPYRLMGKMLKDEALCYLQPVLLNGAEFGSASLSQIRDAASDLVLRCASSMEQGGIATNIGGDDNFALILGIYKPEVECRGRFPSSWKSCTNILGQMPASTETLVFGPEEDPNAQVLVPHEIESYDKKCLGRIFYVKQESDITSWNRRCGTSRGLGDDGNLFLTVTAQKESLGNVSLADTTYIGEDPSISDS
ncbi:MAG: hypothetical protein ASARMPRED_003241 [Alectoria sarmentosa]|nr:MAG: hypothetical protein ASARMPRED_003241 [Alectoria sarmentosa]